MPGKRKGRLNPGSLADLSRRGRGAGVRARQGLGQCLGLCVGLLLAVAGSANAAPLSTAKPSQGAAPSPQMQFPVEAMGFVRPPQSYLPYRIPAATLDFLDATHLLFTFHKAALMQRLPDDPETDMDQTVRAVVIHLPDGKVEAEGSWRLHDRDRYLWMLPGGRFLLRMRNTLYVSDKSLALRIYLHPEGTFVTADFSPDGSEMAVQFANPEPAAAGDGEETTAPSLGADAPHFPDKPKQYTLLLVDNDLHQATRLGHLLHPVLLPLLQGGYLGVEQGRGKDWSVMLNSFAGKQRAVAHVTSACQPLVNPLNGNIFLVRSCIPYSTDRVADAFDLNGKKLWEQMWQSRFTWGTFGYSAAGNRFAYGSVEVNHSVADLDPVDTSSILGQPVGTFDVETGKPQLVLDASPILSAGENFSLSPDGDKLAILRDGSIEVFAMPPLPPSVESATGVAAAAAGATVGH
jgi:hypothetical protein